jgi:hypothetical protein
MCTANNGFVILQSSTIMQLPPIKPHHPIPRTQIVQCPVGRDENIVPTLAGGNNVRGQLPGTQTSIQRDRPTTTALGMSPLDLPRQ